MRGLPWVWGKPTPAGETSEPGIWHSGNVTGETSTGAEQLDSLIADWLTLPDAADHLGLPLQRVRQLLREHQIVAVRRGPNDALHIPADFLVDGRIVKGLPGTLTLLFDAGYNDAEAVHWLFTPDDSLPGTPCRALCENRGTEVKRRAQALGF